MRAKRVPRQSLLRFESRALESKLRSLAARASSTLLPPYNPTVQSKGCKALVRSHTIRRLPPRMRAFKFRAKQRGPALPGTRNLCSKLPGYIYRQAFADLIDGMDLTEEWGAEHLNLSGTNHVE
ncbi:uncharacterized protein K444DRAFT_714020 [Hyaloscypha bicolor E]|uniref:Uncharacterized protein n=1 Tax=Hyaloscypha bicolor E TaxID=1095630 RepID=A0A2J6TMI9_9HELO|nr:uncharacterized protein K444DRAFT_714020 [Hyaloscypha bicolor E]PMD64202.1 hypothetical protein K444DRAFT_714020 [Hyaloscypha bicolor E]